MHDPASESDRPITLFVVGRGQEEIARIETMLAHRGECYRMTRAAYADAGALAAMSAPDACVIDSAGSADGIELASSLAKLHPDMPLIVLVDASAPEPATTAHDAIEYLPAEGLSPWMLARAIDRADRRRREMQGSRQNDPILDEEHFRLLIENALDIITVLEHDGTISYESPSLERVLGFKPEELLGQNAFAYIHPDDLERVLEVFLEGTRVPGMSAGAEFRFMNSKGEYIYLESIGTNLIEHPVVQGVVLNSRDVTERKRAEEALREAHDKLEMRVAERTAEIVEMMARLEQAHHTQRRFVADASHDLRTPLTVIAIEVDLLLQTPDYDDATRESLARIKSEVGQLNDLASDLLLLTMLDDPQPQDTRRDVQIDAILLDEINQLTSLVMEKKARWAIAIGEGVVCRCDLHAMRRALANVLENAVKYSSEGGTIMVSLERDEKHATIVVKDQGMGIDPEDHEKVFERFYRSDEARSTPGTGLGLSIVKAVIDAHDGSVRLESKPGVGTTMIISLPL